MASPAGYAELHAKSYFSFLEGASSPEELIRRAHEQGLSALALTDLNGLYGVVEAREALLSVFELKRAAEKEAGLKLLYGSELELGDDVVTVVVMGREGWGRLCAGLSRGRLAVEKGEFRLSKAELFDSSEGLLALAGGPRSAAMRLVCEGRPDEAAQQLAEMKEAFGDRLYVELVRHRAPGDLERSLAMAALARRLGIPVVATNDALFHERGRKPMQDVLRCIHGGLTLEEAGRRLSPNAEPHLKSPAEMAELFADLPDAPARSLEVVSRVKFALSDVKYLYPPPELPDGETADSFLEKLCRRGLAERMGPDSPRFIAPMEKELQLIAEMEYAGYFLTMKEVVDVCAEKNVLCQGRGSAANSLVCFSLGITSVRPDVIHMLFERFLSKERNEPPDIDLDIEHERREEILQYVYGKYGRHHAGMVSEVIRYRHRSALRDIGKALGFSEQQLSRMSKFLSHFWGELDERAMRASGVEPESPAVKMLVELAQRMEGFPRHLSIHVGGFVLSGEALSEIVPIENGRMADRTVIQWNKDDVDAMGMFKLDLLGLGMLTVLAKCFRLLRELGGPGYTLQNVPEADKETYDMLCRADTVGVFQVESRAQMNMLPRLKPRKFYDLVVEVALVRPGPIQGQMVHPYLLRRRGEEEVTYEHPRLKDILSRTYGVPLFQEQVMQLAEVAAGFTPGEADQLRRDMGSWRANGRMERHRERLKAGMVKNGLSENFAQRVLQQIEGFGSYGFPESHAAAFAHLAYVSAYLKRHHPVPFACSLINSQPMGFYSPLVIINDLKRAGERILPVDVQCSGWDCSVEGGALRLGLRMVRSLGEEAGRAIERARAERPFESIEDMSHRAKLPSRTLVPLAAAGALKSLHTRREAIWKAAAVAQPQGPLLSGVGTAEARPSLPPLEPLEELTLDAQYAAAFPTQHPMELVREALDARGILSAGQLKKARPNQRVTVAGLVITRQRPGEGHFIYVTLEDETGHTDVSLSAKKFEEYQYVVRLSGALVVQGHVQADGDARNVSAHHLEPLDMSIEVPSHDFH